MTEKRFQINIKLAAVGVIALAIAAIGMHSLVPSASAATGMIDVLNVGTCLTTDDAIFAASDCDNGNDGAGDDLDRDDILQVNDVYATYSHDPKTAAEGPRAILENTDLIKVSISDTDRDRRTGVLIRGARQSGDAENALTTADQTGKTLGEFINEAVDGIEDEDYTAYTDPDKYFGQLAAQNTPDSIGNADVPTNGPTSAFGVKGTGTYQPMDVEGHIKVFGYVADNVSNNPDTVTWVELSKQSGGITPLLIDEDRSSGRNGGTDESGPWMIFQANLPDSKIAVIAAIYYQTSEQELLVGNRADGDSNWATDGSDKPVFTSDEIDDEDVLAVEVEGDNDDDPVNLWLKETDRFTGRYEGYIRLTDADGNGPANNNNWGIATGDATSDAIDGAAVVGVQSGPVRITYKDSNGNTQSLRVQIDIQPPTITIDTPSSKSSSTDRSPDFEGSFEDGGSGLMENSFRLYVDNTADPDDSRPILDLVSGVSAEPNDGIVQIRQDYAGYGTDTQYGVLAERDLYFGDTRSGAKLYIESRGFDDGDMTGTFDDGVVLDFEGLRSGEFQVDFQALVIDLAGNVGFSDAEISEPTFIDDLGSEPGDRVDKAHNAIGWYSRHMLKYDDKEPSFDEERSVTGFYGSDSDGNPIIDRSGILLMFDDDIDPAGITTATFDVELDDETDASIIDVDVHDNRVYLKLANELASDETPSIAIASGEFIEDLAGNETRHLEADPFDANDGIAPTLTVTLRDGSGTGTGDEGPSGLTKNTITVRIDSDESIQGAPRLAVVCNSLAYTEQVDGKDVARDLDDYIGGLSGMFSSDPGLGMQPTYTCGDEDDAPELTLTAVSTHSRDGERWEYTWRNLSGSSELPEGGLTAVAYARDRSSYENVAGDTVYSYGASTAGFTFDKSFESPLTEAGGEVQPVPGAESAEARPFVLLEFNEGTTVTIESLKIDDAEVAFDTLGSNRFTYWPLALNLGQHTVDVTAVDAAANSLEFDFDFEVVTKADFVIELLAGWNAISLPADPVDKSLAAVFSNSDIDSVLGWDASNAESPWRFASRVDGVWSTSDQFATLSDIEARYGYWVHSSGFIRQPVALQSRTRGGQFPTPIEIGLADGWSFVGVVDQDGDQTEDHFNTTLRNSDQTPVAAKDYLGEYTRAYTWDTTFNSFNSLEPNEDMKIGLGVWVYKGSALAP